MSKICFALLLSLFFVPVVMAEPFQANVNEEKTYLRTDPSLDSSVLLEMKKNDSITVVEEKDDWMLVRTPENRVGWVKSHDVRKETPVTISQGTPTPSENSNLNPEPEQEPTITDVVPEREFYEISMVLRPGFDKATDHPAGMDDTGFSIGGHVAWFFTPYFGLSIPYTFRFYEGDYKIQTVGGGPVIRYLDLNHFRGSLDGNFIYARAFGHNEIGWSAGWDFTFGFKDTILRPFIGPFVRFEQIYADGPNLTTWSFGLSISLTNFTDLS